MRFAKEHVENILALSPMQEGLLFQYLLNPGNQQYFEQLSLTLSGALEWEPFCQAWRFVVQTNEMLRTVFRWEALEKPVQIVLKEQDVLIRRHDLSPISDLRERERRLDELKTDDRNDPFDLVHGPLFRISLCKLAENRYELMISNHHILFDGWSTGIILQEFFAAYHQLADGQYPVRVRKTGFREYLKWCRTQDQSQTEEYWRTYLYGLDMRTFLPLDWQKTEEVTSVRTLTCSLPTDLWSHIENVSKIYQFTLNSIFAAAWGILLQSYNNQSDILFGTAVAGRPDEIPGIEEMVGLFINTLPVRIPASHDLRIQQLIGQIQKDLQVGQRNGSISPAMLKSLGGVQGEENLFDSLFVFENYPLEQRLKDTVHSLAIENYSIFEMTHYDLVLEMVVLDQIEASFTYNPRLFRESTVERMAEHFVQVLRSMVAEPTGLVRELEMITPEEKKVILTTFNETAANYPTQQTLMEIFAERVAEHPERQALVFGSESLTYRELDERTTRWALFLRRKGVKPNTIVGILAERSPEMLTGIFAILKAGGAYLPLDPAHPAHRIAFMLEDSGSQLLLTQSRFADLISFAGETLVLDGDRYGNDAAPGGKRNGDNPVPDGEWNGDVPVPDGEWDGDNPVPDGEWDGDNPAPDGNWNGDVPVPDSNWNEDDLIYGRSMVSAELLTDRANLGSATPEDVLSNTCVSSDLAYIIYTSGSTGQPKGVMIEHRSAVNILYALQEKYPLGTEDAYLLKTAYTFDVSVAEIFGWMMGGGRLVILPPGEERDPEAMIAAIRQYGVTHVNFVPAMFQLFLNMLEQNGTEHLAGLRYIFVAGEAIGKQTVERFLRLHIRADLENLYGPTEATIYATGFPLRTVPETVNVPIGKPLANVRTYVLNAEGQLQPIGVPGELCLAGRGLARGYLHQPQLTEERFPADSFVPGERMYRTGDLVKWLPDGNIEYMGRIDHQVKIRGFRIELGEIEARLAEDERIESAVVTAREEHDGTRYLCAYYVSEEERDGDELADALKATLPEYMIPAFFVWLEAMPLNSSGKIDRRALPAPDLNRLRQEYTAPRNETEERLAALWSEILGVGRPGITDHFFALGGHSLKATRLVTMIRKEFAVDIPLREIFKRPKLEEMASAIREARQAPYREIRPVAVREYYPVSSAQKRLYVLDQWEGGMSYNLPGLFGFTGEPDFVRLNDAFRQLTARHESLRTSFVMADGEPVQRVADEVSFTIGVRELKSGQAGEKELLDQALHSFVRPFDLSVAPLMRAELLWLDDQCFLLFDMHHIISDGVSVGIMMEEVIRLYHGETLTVEPVQYKDFAVWQNGYLQSEIMREQEKYWLSRYEDEIPVLDLPTDHPRPAVMRFTGEKYPFTLEKETAQGLYRLAQETGTTLFMVLLAVYNVLLAKYSGQEDIVIGAPIAGRNHPGLERIVGMFVNTLALRNHPESTKVFTDFLREVRETAMGAYENQDYQFEKLVERLNLSRDLSRNPLFDVVFVLQNTGAVELKADHFELHPLEYDNHIAKFDLTLSATEAGEGIQFYLEYRTDLFCRETMKRMAGHFLNLLRQVAENAQRPLWALKMIPAEEERRLLTGLNDTETGYPREAIVQQIFEEQAARFPERTAIVCEERSYTYRELNERANQVARQLRERGAGPDQIIGIMVERSLGMIMGILAIIKSGGAYLPIDPDYPADRIEYMLEDAGVELLLTQHSLRREISFDGEMIDLDDEGTYTGDTANLEHENQPGDLLYVIYTSGSTGKPKGVMIEHRNLVRLMFNDRFQFDFTEEDVWTVFHSYCFDFSVWEMYGALLYGGKAIIIPKPVAQSPAEFRKVLQREKVTVLNQTPTAFYNLIREDLKEGGGVAGLASLANSGTKWDGPEAKMSGPETKMSGPEAKLAESGPKGKFCGASGNDDETGLCLRYVIFGGEALKPVILSGWHRKYPKTRLVNMYGITETTVHVTFKELSDQEIASNVSNIGRPIPTLTSYIMDKHLRLLPIGVPGELCVGGEGVARGYLNRPELTEQKFVLNPYRPEERLYRSGDLARMLPDGDMEYLGRIDHQVKIRGFRIELGEIENELLKHPDVKEVIVIPKENSDGEKFLCAYLVARREIPVTELRSHLGKDLPEYMIPAYFMILEQMPLTANGKIHRAALPDISLVRSGREYLAPETETEAKLAEVWARVLEVEQVGRTDNFFELGGDSIKAIRLVNRIQQEMGVPVKIADLYQSAELRELAARLEEAEGGAERAAEEAGRKRAEAKLDSFKETVLADPVLAAKLPADWEDFYPMSDIEQGMVFYSLADVEAAVYHDQMFYQMREREFHSEAWAEAVRLMTEKHPILRTTFHMNEFGEPIQIVHKTRAKETAGEVIDLTEHSRSEQEAAVQMWIAADRKHPLALGTGPLWRIQLFRFDAVNMGFCLVAHHAILDGWSVASFVTELVNTYLRIKADPAYRPEPLRASYREFVVEQMAGEDQEEARGYWQAELEGFKRLELPFIQANGDVGFPRSYEFTEGKPFLKDLEQVAHRYRTTVKNLTLAAYFYMFNMVSFENDLTVGCVTNSRPACEDGEKILGCFLNTVPLRAVIRRGASWIDLVQSLDQTMLRLKPFERVTLPRILEYIGEARTGDNPVFDVIFNFINFHIYEDVQRNMVGDELNISGYVRTNTVFDFSVETTFDEFKVILVAMDGLFPEERVRQLYGYFNRVLHLMIEEPEGMMGKEKVLLSEEKARLLDTFNATERLYPAEKTLPQLLEEQAERTPERIALTFAGRSMTYGELNEKTNRLARLLRAKGVGADRIVGMMLHRSFEMLIGIYGILKAGGAYLPIDPAYPEERIRYMLEDARVFLLLTSRSVREGISRNTFDDLRIRWDESSVRTDSGEESQIRARHSSSIGNGESGSVNPIDNRDAEPQSGKANTIPEDCFEIIELDDPEVYSRQKYGLRDTAFSAESTGSAQCDTGCGILSRSVAPSQLAYIIYTSGSTGKPKGVMIEHRSVVNILYALQEQYPLGAEDAFLLKTSYTFDVSVAELFGWCMDGGRLVILPPGDEKDPQAILDTIGQEGVTHVNFVPPMLNLFLSGLDDTQTERIRSLKYIFVAGEAVQKQTVAAFLRLNTGTVLENLYGPTESTIYATGYPLRSMPESANVPIGRPLANLRAYILDRNGELQPVGIPGELCLAGRGLARGYLHREELTREKFVRNPFAPDGRMYRTGDLVQWLPDGNIEYMGRIDQQVKIRGFRIEPGEIEALLLGYPGITATVVTARDGNDGTKYLCAYYTGEAVIATEDLTRYLQGNVPEYMIPSFFIRLAELPLTYSGKIDRRALPAPDAAALQSEYLPPITAIEEQLAQIWSEILDISPIGRKDHFFHLGGHSLKATRLATRIHREFEAELPMREIFKAPTLEEMAARIEQAQRSNFTGIERLAEREYYPVSSAQQRIYVLQQFESGQTSYNIPMGFEVKGTVDRIRLEDAFRQLIARHEALRTSFTLTQGDPVQMVAADAEFAVRHRGMNGESLAAAIERFVRPFDLQTAPLMRAELLTDGERTFLLFDIHHIIADGVTLQLLIEELVRLYNGENLPGLRVQYRDFAVWQNTLLESEVMQGHEAFWLNTFAGEIPVLHLPTDYPRPAMMSFAGASHPFHIGAGQAEGLYRLARETGTTLYMVLLAAYNLLLARYSGQEDLTVGSPVAGRTHTELERMAGMFVNTLAMRNYPVGEKRWSDFLQEVRDHALQAFEHQDYQFERLVEELNLHREMNRNPLFDVVFVLQNTGQAALQAEGFTLQPVRLENRTAKFDLTLFATEGEGGIGFELEYRTGLFQQETIERMAEHFVNLLDELQANPTARLWEYRLISAAEEERLLYRWNDTTADYPRRKTIGQLFAEQAARTPDRTAVQFMGEEMTYEELNAKANQLARTLRGRGLGPDRIAALLVDRSPEMIVSVLAVVKSGAAYLPIDPDYPSDRIQYMLEDAGVEILLTEPCHHEKLAFAGEWIDVTAKETYAGDVTNPPQSNQPGDLLYIIYTSGSTGKPKGVMIEHRNVVRLLFNDKFQFDFSENDIWTVFHSYCFDFSVWEMYGALLYGGKAVIVAKPVAQNPVEFLRLLKEEKVTVLNQTPTAFYNLMKEDRKAAAEASADEQQAVYRLCLRYVIFGGEALKPMLLREWHRQNPRTKLINMYGITETTVHVTYKELGDEDMDSHISNIGTPIPTLTGYIMDSHRSLLPIGVPGELCVGGDGVARGYLNRPELTEEKFVPNPYRREERLYRSGDLARRLSNGDLEYLGRIDQQVKIRGFRIELGEIEDALLRHSDVSEAVVIPRENQNGDQFLSAYLVAHREISVAELRSHLAQSLPDYMIPAYFMPLDQMPLTANGKINRSLLPLPQAARSGHTYEPPVTPLEKQMAGIWSGVLEAAAVGQNDNFFELGGDSIKAIRLINRVQQELGIVLTMSDLYQHAELKALAAHLGTMTVRDEKVQREQAEAKLRSLRNEILANPELAARLPEDWEDMYPMSDIEQGMVFHSLTDESAAVYHDQIFYQFREWELDETAWKRALALLTARHPILRTSFHMNEWGDPMQMIHRVWEDDSKYAVHLLDLSGLTLVRQREAVEAWLAEDRKRPFVMTEAPLWRIQLFRFGGGTMGLCLITHHAILDGWSVASFVKELVETYTQLKDDAGFRPEPLRSSYRDFVVEQITLQHDNEVRQYWQSELTDYKRLELPYGTDGAGQPRNYIFTEDREFLHDLTQTAGLHKVSVKALCLAAYFYMFRMISYEWDLTVGYVTNSRPLTPDGDRILGCFLNTVPLRMEVRRETRWMELAKSLEEKLHRLKAYERVPLVRILEMIGEQPNPEQPVFDVFFNFINFHVLTGLEQENAAVRLDIPGYVRTNTSFDFSVDTTFDDFKVLIVAMDSVFSGEQVHRMYQYFRKVLGLLIHEPDGRMEKDRVIHPEEKYRLLNAFNATERRIPAGKTLAELFEEQAGRTPHETALEFDGSTITYGEMNDAANRLAHHLRRLGVGRNRMIGLIAERSQEMLIGIYAVLKAGGAYLPIDPDYPGERIRYMLEDAEVCHVLTLRRFSGFLPEGVHAVELDGVHRIEMNDTSAGSSDTANLPKINEPGDLAYMIYTSGSTGKPKGVMIEQRSVVNILHALQEQYPLHAGGAFLLKTAYTFDVSVAELFGWILGGGRLVILWPGDEKDPQAILRTIERTGVTHINFVPSMLNVFLSHLDRQNLRPLASLQYIFAAGEPIQKATVKEFLELGTGIALENLYGPTESTIYATGYSLRAVPPAANVPIGRPLANLRAYVLDREDQLQPVGIPGELCLGGEGLARGYLHQEELTREKFTGNPYINGERMYRTGDLVKWLPDGNIEFLGRIDQQVKIRGFRIELGEIENQIRSHTEVREALVLAKGETGDAYLCAYVVTERLTVGDLKEFLSGRLPEYMIPEAVVILPSLPLNRNGKVDRRALPEPDRSGGDGGNFAAPENERELRMAAIWSEILGVGKIGRHDRFFDLGGHSLRAAKLMGQVWKEFGVRLQINDLFRYSTIAELTAWIERKEKTAYDEIPRLPEQPGYELSYTQQRLWIIDQLHPGTAAYNLSGGITLHEAVDPAAAERIFTRIAERHETLRTHFTVKEGRAVQIVEPTVNPAFVFHDLTPLESGERERCRREIRLEVSRSPFHLETGPLFRAALVKAETAEFDLIFSMHHIISDGVSLTILQREFAELYAASKEGRTAVLPELPVQYKDFAAWQNRLLADEAARKPVKEFWAGQLSGDIPALRLPVDFTAGTAEGSAAFRMVVPAGVLEGLKKLAHEEEMTLFMVMLAGFTWMLNRITGQEDILVGFPAAAREHESLKHLIGFFVNTLVLRNQVTPAEPFRQFAGRVQKNAVKALEYQDFPLELMLDELQTGYPEIPVFFNWLNTADRDQQEVSDWEPRHLHDVQDVKFDQAWYLTEYRNGIEISCHYRKGLFQAATVEYIVAEYVRILTMLAANPEYSLQDTMTQGAGDEELLF